MASIGRNGKLCSNLMGEGDAGGINDALFMVLKTYGTKDLNSFLQQA